MAMLNNQRVLTMWAWGKQPCQRSEATEDPILGGFHGSHDPPKNSPSCDWPSPNISGQNVPLFIGNMAITKFDPSGYLT